MSEKSTRKCPCCKQPLSIEGESLHDGGMGVIIWCSFGRCDSIAANDGYVAPTEAEAFAGLEKQIDTEFDTKPE